MKRKNNQHQREDQEQTADVDTESTHPDDAEPDPDQTAELIDSLEAQRDDFENKWKLALADLQNFQRRAAKSEAEARTQGATSVLHSVIPVLDHFDQALSQQVDEPAAKALQDGVRVIKDEFVRALSLHGVSIIEPKPNDPFDPAQHEAISQLPQEGIQPGHIAVVTMVGYKLADRVIRSAKVVVTPQE